MTPNEGKGQNLGVLGERASCPFKGQNRGAGKSRKDPGTLRIQRKVALGEKTANLKSKRNAMVRRVAITRRAFIFLFRRRFLAVPHPRQGF